ncbi:helix-turn-helix domain-containing protein [Sediminibacillus dalangtanensis]|uniref:Helix-turn-helix domain-containing protein n=1 Tax=Sediminibacillus dalangtanensis TaxID=2729421 RepID=A0ABX7VYP2_9BACI|nr:RodZ domain-containing protein [Sediminibacillus dalangtanensis]QTM99477.1 helix-turn-helix domain-containing protein [Sediminibacillus dalangtanensis]
MEIGERLKEAREAKNLSLEEIQQMTKIQTRYLQAIEKGNFSVMPGNFYVRAFIKEYATAVDLDPDVLMEEHKGELPATSDESAVQYTRVQRSRKESSASTKSPAVLSFLPTVIVVLLVIGILFTVWYLYQQSQGDDPSQSNQQNEEQDEVYVGDPDSSETEENDDSGNNDAAEEQTEEETQQEDSTNEEEQAEPELNVVDQGTQGNDQVTNIELVNPGEDIVVEVASESDHWLEITEGEDNDLYSGMFGESESPLEEDLSGADQFMIRFGNPEPIEITIAGVPLEIPEMSSNTVQRVFVEVVDETEQQE